MLHLKKPYHKKDSFSKIEKVTKVIAGDTFKTDSMKRSVRLANVNAPEKGSKGSGKATQVLRDFVQGQTVSIESVARDKYGRSVAKVKVGNRSVNAAMRRKGYK